MKKVLLILGVVLVGLTSCKKEEVEEVEEDQSENCYCGEVKIIGYGPFGQSLGNFITECDTIGVYNWNPNWQTQNDSSNVTGDTVYWRIATENQYFAFGDSIMFIKYGNRYLNCN